MSRSMGLILLLGMSCYTMLHAATKQEDLDKITREAKADGTLLGMATFCKLPEAQIHELHRQQKTETLLEAQRLGVTFPAGDYQNLSQAGSQEILDFLVSYIQPGTSAYHDNCREIRTKVKNKLASKAAS